MSIITNEDVQKAIANVNTLADNLMYALSEDNVTVSPEMVSNFIGRHNNACTASTMNKLFGYIAACVKTTEPQDDGMKEMLDLFNKLIQKYKIPASQNDVLLRKAIEDAFAAYDVYTAISAKINAAYPNSINTAEDFSKYVEYYMNMANNTILNNPMFNNVEALKQELSAYKTKYGELDNK